MTEPTRRELKAIAKQTVLRELVINRLSLKINSLWHELHNYSLISRLIGKKRRLYKLEQLEKHLNLIVEEKETVKDFLIYANSDKKFLLSFGGSIRSMVQEIEKLIDENDLENALYNENYKELQMPYHMAPRLR